MISINQLLKRGTYFYHNDWLVCAGAKFVWDESKASHGKSEFEVLEVTDTMVKYRQDGGRTYSLDIPIFKHDFLDFNKKPL